MKIDWMEIEELAQIITGIDVSAGSDEIELALYEKFEISFEAFDKLIQVLARMTPPAKSALFGTTCTGFVHEGAFVVKVKGVEA